MLGRHSGDDRKSQFHSSSQKITQETAETKVESDSDQSSNVDREMTSVQITPDQETAAITSRIEDLSCQCSDSTERMDTASTRRSQSYFLIPPEVADQAAEEFIKTWKILERNLSRL